MVFAILSPFLCNCVLNSLLVDLRNSSFDVQAYADNVAILVPGANMVLIKDRAQNALNIASHARQGARAPPEISKIFIYFYLLANVIIGIKF